MMNLASLVLRVSLGAMFAGHGLQKCFGLFGGPGIDGFTKMLSAMGFTPALFWAYLAAYVELIGGLFLIFGILVRTSSSLLLILIAVAALKVHIPNGFFLSAGGFEYTLIIAAVCFALIISGAGKYSIYNKL
ncbi:MAG: DoxX family protein [Candidatus Omnitrophica bacterium]|nr:DoxX family protein [Candidatus Omnitrophota bacterium]